LNGTCSCFCTVYYKDKALTLCLRENVPLADHNHHQEEEEEEEAN